METEVRRYFFPLCLCEFRGPSFGEYVLDKTDHYRIEYSNRIASSECFNYLKKNSSLDGFFFFQENFTLNTCKKYQNNINNNKEVKWRF